MLAKLGRLEKKIKKVDIKQHGVFQKNSMVHPLLSQKEWRHF